ncbi:hypothetical protein ACJMK2_016596 [Sinanodonta woodiana]|uniref:Nephrocystin 3-like N-terminal domain-containing protein n=1 Tax=Sinanodonta woodiana TaxID=1069815 RepID=A0ABD3UU90_SINWO
MVQLSSDSDEEGVLVRAPSEKFQLRKQIRPYVTSTSEDFEEERNFLSENIFPVLDQQCQLRGCAFSPINVQWQPGDNVTLTGQLLRLNLDCISKCSPFFICLLGQTYGPFRSADSLQKDVSSLPSDADWLDRNYIVAASAGYSWILHESRQNCSITELEIIQAAFLSDNRYCYFYYRQPEHLDAKLEGKSKDERDTLMKTFLPSSEDGDFKIRDLKQRIVKKGISVKYFRTLEELGDHVLKDWSMVVNEIYPPLVSAPSVIETEEYREWISHESFAENHRQVFVTSPDLNCVMEELTNFAIGVLDDQYSEMENFVPVQSRYRNYSISSILRKPESFDDDKSGIESQCSYSEIKEKNLMVLTGDRGSGKSTLVANWLKQFKEENPEVKVIFHFVGSNGHSRDISVFLRHCIKDLREEYLKDDTMLDDASIFEPKAATTFQELYEGFQAAISLSPCVLVVEGVDELGSTLGIEPQQIKKFEWIPLPLPSYCRMILTTSTSDFSYRSLSERGDIKHLTLPQLKTASLKMKYLEEHMQMHYNHLKQEHVSIILESKLSSRPLFLTLLGNEIASFSVYTDLKAFLENTVEMCSSLRDLFTRCIKRWKKELSWSWEVIPTDGSGDEEELEYMGWIPDILRLLAVSRSGLTQREILDVLYQIGYQENVTVSMFDWLLFLQCAGSCLYEKPNGLINFSHQHMREIVEYELLRTVKPSAADIVPLQSDKDKVWREKKKSYHKHLVQYFSSLPISQHCVEELPWQLLMSGDFEGLTKVVTDPRIFMMLADPDGQNPSNVHDLLMYWHYLQSQGVSPAKSYLQVLVKAGVISHDIEAQELSVDGSVLEEEDSTIKESSHNGFPTSPVVSRINTASPRQGRQLSVIEESFSTMESETNLARHKIITKKSQEQITDEKENMDNMFVAVSKSSDGSLTKLNLADGKLTKLTWHIGVLLRDLGEISVAEKVFTALQDLLYKNFPLSEENQLLLARVTEVLGQMYLEKGNADDAEKMLKKTLHMLMDIPDAEEESSLLPCIEKMKGEVLSQIGYLRLNEGILDDAEDLLQESLEFSEKWGTLSHRATILFHFGLLRVKQGDFMMAENSLRNALSLRERWYGKSHPLIAEVLFHLAKLMCNPANDRFDKYNAEDIFRRALDIREKYYGKEHTLCGDVLFELGKMLSEESSFAAKMEACRLLSKALDVRIRKLVCLTNQYLITPAENSLVFLTNQCLITRAENSLVFLTNQYLITPAENFLVFLTNQCCITPAENFLVFLTNQCCITPAENSLVFLTNQCLITPAENSLVFLTNQCLITP